MSVLLNVFVCAWYVWRYVTSAHKYMLKDCGLAHPPPFLLLNKPGVFNPSRSRSYPEIS